MGVAGQRVHRPRRRRAHQLLPRRPTSRPTRSGRPQRAANGTAPARDRRRDAGAGRALRHDGGDADHQPVRHGDPRVRGLPRRDAPPSSAASAPTRRPAAASSRATSPTAGGCYRRNAATSRRASASWDDDQTATRRLRRQTGADIDLVSNPKGMAFEQWLRDRRASRRRLGHRARIDPAFHNTDGVVAPTQQWLYWGGDDADPLHLQHAGRRRRRRSQCGRVVFSDWHADDLGSASTNCPYSSTDAYSATADVPGECDAAR